MKPIYLHLGGALALTFTIAACIPAPDSTPAPEPVQTRPTPTPAPPPVTVQPTYENWMDAPRTPGNWHYTCPDVGMALLLLLYAGFYLQLTYQHLLAVLAVLLLGRIARPLGAQPDPVVESGPAAGEAALKPEKSEQHVVTT